MQYIQSLPMYLQIVLASPLVSPMMASAFRKLWAMRRQASASVSPTCTGGNATSASQGSGASDWTFQEIANVCKVQCTTSSC